MRKSWKKPSKHLFLRTICWGRKKNKFFHWFQSVIGQTSYGWYSVLSFSNIRATLEKGRDVHGTSRSQSEEGTVQLCLGTTCQGMSRDKRLRPCR